MKIALVYFSATTQTKKMADVIAQAFTAKGATVDMHDITPLSSRQAPLDCSPYDAVVLGAPIHSCRAPRVVRDWLRTLDGQGKKAAMFFTYGAMQVHPTHYSTKEILTEQGFTVVSSAEFLAAHTFNIGGWEAVPLRPDESDSAVARDYVASTYDRFTDKDTTPLSELEKTENTEEFLDSIEALRFKVLTMLPTRNGEECSMCMICEESCPTGAMNAENGEAEQGRCIACLACVAKCPEDALKINDMSQIWTSKLEMEQVTEESIKQKKSKIYL